MTNRTRHLTVILEEDMRVDDVEGVRQALLQNRNVAEVIVGQPPDLMPRAAKR